MGINKIKLFIAVFSLCSLMTACGGGSASTGAYSTGVTKTISISKINQRDYGKICKSIVEWLVKENTLEGLCTLSGIFFAAFVAEDGNLI